MCDAAIGMSAAVHAPPNKGAPAHAWPSTADRQFVRMLDAFRGTGGLARPAEIVGHLQTGHDHAGSVLMHWIEQRRVICFDWDSRDWIPWFQFSRHTMAPHSHLMPVLIELNTVYDAWEQGNWFATPNPWLAEHLPIDTLLTDLPAVLHAARADRFIANG